MDVLIPNGLYVNGEPDESEPRSEIVDATDVA